MSTPNINSTKRSYFQDRKVWFLLAAGIGLVTIILLAFFLQALSSTTKYYVLAKDLPARTLVTPDMLEERVVSTGGQPPTAIDLSQISANEVYTKVELQAGDIITTTNAGLLLPLTSGLPEDFVIASFTAGPNQAAGGNITRGDYVDIFYVDGGSQSTLLFQRVLIVETAANLTDAASSDETITPTEETATAGFRGGIPEIYTVGLSQENAAKLAVVAGQSNLYLVLSSRDSVENGANPLSLGFSLQDLLFAEAGDAGFGTDNSFPAPTSKETEGDSSSSSGSGTGSDQTTNPADVEATDQEETPSVEEDIIVENLEP